MHRPETIAEMMPYLTAQSADSLARCVKDIDDARALRSASPAHRGTAIGHVLDRLEQEFKITFAEQMQADDRR